MTVRDDFDRTLGPRLNDLASGRQPDYLATVLAKTSKTRQRSPGLDRGRWPRVEPVIRVADRPRTQLTVLLAAALVVVLALAALLAIGSRPSTPLPFKPRPLGQNGLIAFDAGGDIFMVNPDGTGLRRFTTTPDHESNPAWSPDGTQLAWWRMDAASLLHLEVEPAAGGPSIDLTGSTRLGTTTRDISWSPDGRSIAFDATPQGVSRVFIAPVDGRGIRPITDIALQADLPAWSPDGSTVFAHARIQQDKLRDGYVAVDPATGATRTLAISPSDQIFTPSSTLFSWSPDGTRVAYYRDPRTHGEPQDIWVIGLDGATSALTTSSDDESGPRWSPDGTRIAFRVNPGGTTASYATIRPTGTGLTAVPVSVPTGPAFPVWSPDAKRLLVIGLHDPSTPGATQRIQLVDPDGRLAAITFAVPGPVGEACWQWVAP